MGSVVAVLRKVVLLEKGSIKIAGSYSNWHFFPGNLFDSQKMNRWLSVYPLAKNIATKAMAFNVIGILLKLFREFSVRSLKKETLIRIGNRIRFL